MTTLDPLDPYSEVVDTNRRWTPDWYSWITQLAKPPSGGGGGGLGNEGNILYNSGGNVTGTLSALWNSSSGSLRIGDGSAPSGIAVQAFNPNLPTNNPTDHNALKIDVTTDSSTTDVGFTNEEAVEINFFPVHGQATNGGSTTAKKTFLTLNTSQTARAAGQKFIYGQTMISYGMSDTAIWGNQAVQYSGGPVNGDEGQGWALVSDLKQQGFLVQSTISTVTTSSYNSTTTQAITASTVAQTVTVASTSGAGVGDWVVIDQQIPSASPTMEAVQITAVGIGTITAIFYYNHSNGATIKPALVLDVGSGDANFMGQDRIIINLSATPVTTGTVSSISGGGFTGTGTSWANNMVGGNSLNIGAISLATDDYTNSPFDSGSNRLRSWYEILNVGTTTAMGIYSTSVAGDASYRGKGAPSTFTIRPKAKVLRVVSSGNSATGKLICENSTSTWSVGHIIEMPICPYPDVSGFQYHMAAYTNGGSYRGFMSVINNGGRMMGTAFGCDSLGPVSDGLGTGGADTLAWDVGIRIGGRLNTGIDVRKCLQGAITINEYLADAGSAVAWPGFGTHIRVNTTNVGMDFQTCTSSGLMQYVNAGAGSNPSSTMAQQKWSGSISLKANIVIGTGNVTLNFPCGIVIMAASATSLVLTNDLITADSLVFAMIKNNDATAVLKNVVPTVGSATFRMATAPTNDCAIAWHVINPF